MEIVSQPNNNCPIPKKSDQLISFLEPDLVQDAGSQPLVVVQWDTADTGVSGTFLGKTITLGNQNIAGEWDGTPSGFITMIRTCFPELASAEFILGGTGPIYAVTINFPDYGVYPDFEFDAPGLFDGLGIASINGTAPVERDCYFDIRIFDEEDDLICRLEDQYPEIVDGIVQPLSISYWNTGLATTFPPTGDVDDTFCRKIRFRAWLRCASDEGCGYSPEQMVESDLFTVTNSVHDSTYEFSQHCVLDRFFDGTLARFLTEREKVCICPDIETWLWICPSLMLFDEAGLNYNYAGRYTHYDADGNQLSFTDFLIGGENAGYSIPTGYNYISLNPNFPANTSHYTVELVLILDGNTSIITRPVTYHITDCCCEFLLYFQEQLGSVSHICFEECESVKVSGKADTVCTNGNIGNIATEVNKTYRIRTELCEQDKDLLSKSTKFWTKLDGHYQSVSIESRDISLKSKDTFDVELTVRVKDPVLNEC